MKQSLIVLFAASILLASCGKSETAPIITTPTPVAMEQTTATEPSPVTNTKNTPVKPTPETTAPTTPSTTTTKSYTSAEVAVHGSGSDCWLILDNKVYDVTSFIPKHPGGEAILRGCGKDATQMFARHPESAKAMKEKFYIGDLKA